MKRLSSSRVFGIVGLASLLAGMSLSGCDQQAEDQNQDSTSTCPIPAMERPSDLAQADDAPQGAKQLGVLAQAMPALSQDEVTLEDRTDFFRFEVSRYGQVRLRLEKHHDASLFVIVREIGPSGGRGPAVIDFWQDEPVVDHQVLLPKGEYLLEIKNRSEDHIPYELGMMVTPAQGEEANPDPGSEMQSATDLGRMEEEGLQLSGYVGIVDPVDYYRVQIPADRELRVQGASEQGDFEVTLVDLREGQASALSKLEDSSRSGEREDLALSEAGVYYLKVESRSRFGASYQVQLALR